MRKNFPNIAFLLMLFSTIVFADVHPVLKEAIDKKNYTQAEKIVKNTGIKDVYCPSTLSAKDAKKIYGKLFADSVALLMKNCDMEFAISYLDYDCAGGKNKTACLNLVNLTDPNLWPQKFSTQFCTKKNVEICAAAIERVPAEKAVPFLQKIKNNKLAELKKEKGIRIRVGGETKDECIRSCEWMKENRISELQRYIRDDKFSIDRGLPDHEYAQRMRDIRNREDQIAEVNSRKCPRVCAGKQGQATAKNFTEYYFGEAFAILSQKIAQYYMDWKNPIIQGLAENWIGLDNIIEKMKDEDAEILNGGTDLRILLTTASMIEKKYERFPNFITKKIVLDTLKSSFSRNSKIDPLEQLFYCKIYPSIERESEKEFGVKFVDCEKLLKDNARIMASCEDGSSLLSGRVICKNGEYTKNYSVSRKGEYVVMQENLFNQIPNENVWCPTSGFINCMRRGPLYTWKAGMQACPKGWKIPNEKEMEYVLRNIPLKRMPMNGFKGYMAQRRAYGKRSYYMTSNSSVCYSVDSTGAWDNARTDEKTMLSVLCIKESVENEKCSEEKTLYDVYCCENGQLRKKTEPELLSGKFCDERIVDSIFVGGGKAFVCDASGYKKLDQTTVAERYSERLFYDQRDGRIYPITTIGNQVWMAENLNYAMIKSYCYKNDSLNCEKYGRLYSWKNALDACPTGWHLPSKDEWENLISFVQEGELPIIKGESLMSTRGWLYEHGTDLYGFSALPAGKYQEYDQGGGGYFDRLQDDAYFWSSTADGGEAYRLNLYGNVSKPNIEGCSVDNGFSVRCLRDSN